MGRSALSKITSGLYIASSMKDGKFNGQIINSPFRVTAKPLTAAISINKENLTYEYIQASKLFSLSLLAINAPMAFIGLFGPMEIRNMELSRKQRSKTYRRTGSALSVERTSPTLKRRDDLGI